MEFKSAIQQYSVKEITETLGCPERIAYAWHTGDRQPRPWIQRLVLAELGRRVKPNKAPSKPTRGSVAPSSAPLLAAMRAGN